MPKILIKFPSRNRPLRFFNSLNSVFSTAYNPENIFVLATLDSDDSSMNNGVIIDRLQDYNDMNICVIYGQSKSKVDAINRDMDTINKHFPAAADWDILVVLSDDIRFTFRGWDEIIAEEMRNNFPDNDGYLHFKEKDTQKALNVMEIMGRPYYERFGYIYHPSYKSLWCDNEKTEIAKMLRKYVYVDLEIFVHENPAYGYQPKDEMFIQQQDLWADDEENFRRRKCINFEIEKYRR